ncbi:MAG: hypothetical protein OEW19_18890, partial [Acidobacteriota bacterium]|nr:hypothetical protein [Acidobacteriota bacterium]
WLPVLVSAVLVFVASSVIHMFTPWHKGDRRGVPGEEEAMAALRRLKLPPGDYVMPYATSMEAMKSPEFVARLDAGPAVLMTVWKGTTSMTGSLLGWFVYSIVVGVFSGYLAGAALPVGASYLEVFRFAGTTAFAGYALAVPHQSIWWKQNWGTTMRTMIDGLLYGCLTAGTFGWLWPR